ncbi:Protein CBG19197 [Caenorhabditis briggsae]|uniref:CX domain-containing protein n=2 Tax=Caenorhabditis briggsae TaxID=6238 RepID=A0AAE9AAA6_CAEBR|nr:Protein CBG19197 [Caenorhabditis briggsae]ULT90668.1 hypothetical protein L3Y34_008769 [Caenorhabditis briggsae]CAP36488.1 Protein CBG19197 [Caenorhabditis briggsae]
MKSALWFLFALLMVGCLCQISPHRGPRMSNTFRFSTYTREAKVHIFRSTKSSVIVAPSLPIRFNDINYYWYGNYVFDDSHPLKCEYDIDESDHEFISVVHKDGSKPQSLQYGCLNYEQCCGLECCGDIRTSTVTMCIVFLIFLGLCVAVSKYNAYVNSRRESVSMNAIRLPRKPRAKKNAEIHEV